MNWEDPYRPEMIEGTPTITGGPDAHHPGKKIARSITEMHEKVAADVELDLAGGLEGEAEIDNNTLKIRIDASGVSGGGGEGGGGDTLPSGGESGMVLTLRLSSSNERSYVWDWVRGV